MAELLLILNSEEIPAGMQEAAARRLVDGLSEELKGFSPTNGHAYWGARHIAASLEIAATLPAAMRSERGPRDGAPEQALAGFLRKHGAKREDLVLENGFWVLNVAEPELAAAARIAEAVPALLWKFSWPKSMRWGSGSGFTWVRPLRRIVCVLDGAPVPFSLARDGDDAHGLVSGTAMEGHRFLAPEAFEVTGCAQWIAESRARFVLVDPEERLAAIHGALRGAPGVEPLPAGTQVAPDEGLEEEVSGLTQWPTLYFGRIDDAFMDLPPEVMKVSMRVNQRYFALRHADGKVAPWFAFFANMAFSDGGALTKAGNERVLRARFSDARHFWDLDRKTKLIDRAAALETVTFHARLGTQAARVRRIEALAGEIADALDADRPGAMRAARLAKADLTSGMVGEFPELQGVMGGYYALHDGETPEVAQAVREHYMPLGQDGATPRATLSVIVALADRLDLLAGFFAIGETPTGSGDPYGLRRAALGVIRIIRDNGLRLDLNALFDSALRHVAASAAVTPPDDTRAVLTGFVAERLRVQLRGEGERHDVLAAILSGGLDGDLVRLLARTQALAEMLGTEDGVNLLAASKRAANILRIEDRKDGPHEGAPDPALYAQEEEHALASALGDARAVIRAALAREDFAAAMKAAAGMRPALDRFFDAVTVNDSDPHRRANRLRLLKRLGDTLAEIAEFSRIDG
ncbi:glycine--tRNA ligase subunit beta [Acidomonas methanolica]|uniref:Glycine--tRNA ligase beta subunit n=1 Tax=Acidomonas methanolica NBRC 104435 TaxID=1231351 RepID=A0A023D1I3_ACIMT|nr:glycine--tRNA ligase subunit beta [Acidomonas methanolica]MBU2652820.1 glycine--tRNA ligase subunit beta [Acidomonas methanolica]TCS31224.1 glycyl-tRNA synthetase beta chain [Acidomonas methanolica]GAJ27934.1 glycyl-tRNA synthetase subunit beta [Acidomonas methanolica NBRC 104435]GBQ50330.1 glycyl-tRNA synthetase subunit beta [Acidomonas methanolica]GEK98529.1 glycine--tRNA ligase beta subunit [Acidomonas methanolica NBRC 104435]